LALDVGVTMEACLGVYGTFFPHILIPLDLFSLHCNELYSFSPMDFLFTIVFFSFFFLFMVFESMYYRFFVCFVVGTTSLLVSRAVVWDTVGMHNGWE